MNLREYLSVLNRKKATVVSLVAVFLLIGAVLTFSQPFKYKANSTVLVTQTLAPGVDPYNASRANEYLSGILARVISSNSFFNEVMNSGFNIDKAYFSDSAYQQAKIWKHTVYAAPVSDTGLIEISVFHPDKYQLEQIVRAVNYTLNLKHSEYDGGGENIGITVVNKPVYSNWPASPNIPFNLAAAFLLGFIASLFYAYLFPEEKYNISIWPRRLAENSLKRFKDYRASRQSAQANREATQPAAHFPEMPGLVHASAYESDIDVNTQAQDRDDIMEYQDIIKQGSMENVLID